MLVKLKLDARAVAELDKGKLLIELQDEEGRIFAYLHPTMTDDGVVYDVFDGPNVTDAELDRIEQTPGGRTLAEILADLEKRS